MRNDALDELDELPSLTPDVRMPPDSRREASASAEARAPQLAAAAPRGRGSRAPWLLSALLLAALAGLGWWSQQQLARLEQQLVATQESFARISEDAAGRLKDISGKVVATESSVTSESEALKLRIKQMEGRLAQLGKQQQSASEQLDGQERKLEQLRGELKSQRGAAEQLAAALREQQGSASQLAATLKEQQGGLSSLDGRLKGLAEEQAALKAAQGQASQLEGRLQGLAGDVALLKKQGNPAPAIKRLEDDLLVLRSQLDSRPAAAVAGTAELDAFRAQMTRNITTLQAQVQNLQQQLNAR
ncbi:conserved hypothetical protein [Pseudomonas sp. OF001]|uniref:ATPase n=1 Tax=Pseudomonas sp. OF001 TaxID=2772300 RepID=UPI0019180033|nr:ATPase [Pseudomonas sp. OF001]CAD5375722.1 conserved hypothetical protein [Pseudomonas sp. OF001]